MVGNRTAPRAEPSTTVPERRDQQRRAFGRDAGRDLVGGSAADDPCVCRDSFPGAGGKRVEALLRLGDANPIVRAEIGAEPGWRSDFGNDVKEQKRRAEPPRDLRGGIHVFGGTSIQLEGGDDLFTGPARRWARREPRVGGGNRQHGNRRSLQDAHRRRPKEQPIDARVAVRAEDKQIGVRTGSRLHDFTGRIADRHVGFHAERGSRPGRESRVDEGLQLSCAPLDKMTVVQRERCRSDEQRIVDVRGVQLRAAACRLASGNWFVNKLCLLVKQLSFG